MGIRGIHFDGGVKWRIQLHFSNIFEMWPTKSLKFAVLYCTVPTSNRSTKPNPELVPLNRVFSFLSLTFIFVAPCVHVSHSQRVYDSHLECALLCGVHACGRAIKSNCDSMPLTFSSAQAERNIYTHTHTVNGRI